jgi:hypothetical protein
MSHSTERITPVKDLIAEIFESNGHQTFTVNDIELAYAILAQETGPEAFTKTGLEAIFLRKLLTVEGDDRSWGTPLGHFSPDHNWEVARSLTNHILNLSSENREEKAAHRELIGEYAQGFFEEHFGEGKGSVANKVINANDLTREFASGYIMAILFKDGRTLDSEKIKLLVDCLAQAQKDVFYLYLLANAKKSKWKWLVPIATKFIQPRFDAAKKTMASIVGETLKAHPDSHFNQAVQSYEKQMSEQGGEEVVITEAEKIGQGVTQILAGSETTAAVLAFGVRELAINPELAKKFLQGNLPTTDFVTHILAHYPPADLYRVAPSHGAMVDGVEIPPKSILRMNPAELHARKAAQTGKALSRSELVTFGRVNTARLCAGLGIAMKELVVFFDKFRERVAKVEYKGKPQHRHQVDINLSNRPKEPWVKITLK